MTRAACTTEALVLIHLAIVHIHARDFRAAAGHARQAVDLFERVDDPWGVAIAMNFPGAARQSVGNLDGALACHCRAFETFRVNGHRDREPWTLGCSATPTVPRGTWSGPSSTIIWPYSPPW